MQVSVKPSIEACNVREYVPAKLVQDWPKMPDKSVKAFRRFTAANNSTYNLVRKGDKIFAIGTDLAECVYNHSRQF